MVTATINTLEHAQSHSLTLTKAKQVSPLNLERPQNGPYGVTQNKISDHKGKKKKEKKKRKKKGEREKHVNGYCVLTVRRGN